MAEALLNPISRVSANEFLPLFSKQYLLEWIRDNRFKRYMSDSDQSPIQYKYELKGQGDTIQFNFLRRATGSGVGGNMRLRDRESTLGRDFMKLKVDYQREAFAVTKRDEKKSIVELLPSMKPSLMNWSKERLRDRIIDAFFMNKPDECLFTPLYNPDPTRVQSGDPAAVTITTTASSGNATTFLTNNQDRVVFGLADASWSTTLNTALGNVSASTDGLTVKMIQRLHDYAKNSDPHIKPLKVGDEDEEYFVAFTDTKSFRQLQADPVMVAANQYARAREGEGWKRNPIRTGSDLEYDGIIIREVPELMPVVLDSGQYRAMRASDSSGIKATARGRIVVAGVGAVAVGIGQDPEFPEETQDYRFRRGIAVEEMLGVNAMMRQDVTDTSKYILHGHVTGFTNATA